MNIDDIEAGQMVRHPDEPEPGKVTEIDYDDHMVYVEFVVPGSGGRTDIVDVDPAELESA